MRATAGDTERGSDSVDGYGPATYGEGFADVYDDWYGARGDAGAAVDRLAALAGGGAVLELGVGTGRLAVPLAARGLEVWGIDASPAMLARLAAKPGGDRVVAVAGDMAELALGPDSPAFGLVFAADNTLFNLADPGAQLRCLRRVASLLGHDGRLVIEAFVPDDDPPRSAIEVRDVAVDRVVLSISRCDPDEQVVTGQHVELSEEGTRLRPWRLRWSTPVQLDELATQAGFALDNRWSGWQAEPFDDTSTTHVSVYVRR